MNKIWLPWYLLEKLKAYYPRTVDVPLGGDGLSVKNAHNPQFARADGWCDETKACKYLRFFFAILC